MPANVYQVGSATEIQFFGRNYTYADALTYLKEVSFIIFSDLEVMGFTDPSGNLKKNLVDASGATAATEDYIFFANADGEADTDSNLQWDGSDLLVNGNAVHADPDTITLTNNGHTATISLDASGRLAIVIDTIEQVSYSNGGPE